MAETVYCTIITKRYLAHARALQETLAKHNPQARLFVLLADRLDGYFDPDKEPFTTIQLEDLGDQEPIEKMCFYYRVSELCFALRPWLHGYILRRTEAAKWIYLDSDIMVCHSLQDILEQLETTSVLLSPHLLSKDPSPPTSEKAIRTLESYMAHTGLYNGGFLGLRRSEECEAFIPWLKNRLQFYAFDNRPTQNGDQFWLTFVPMYFAETSILREPGANLAYWNLYERSVDKDDSGSIRVNDKPLLFFHFAGFDVTRPGNLTKYGIPKGLSQFPEPIKELAESYRQLLLAKGYEDVRDFPYAFAKFETGEPITPLIRQIYFDDVFNGRVSQKGSPFKHYRYFKSRSRSRRLKTLMFRAGRGLVRKTKRSLNPNFDFEVPSW